MSTFARSWFVGLALTLAVPACGGTHMGAGEPDATHTGGPDATQTGGADAGGAADAAPPDATGASARIQHIIIIVNENHTFDNLFGSYPGADGITHIDGPNGGFDAPQAPDSTRDFCHAHNCALTDWDGGAMDGWFSEPNASKNGDHLAWSQYHRKDIPGLWALADNYGLADHFFSSMLGPSFPGHTFALAAEAGGAIGNPSASYLPALPIWGCDDPVGTTVATENEDTCQTDKVVPCFKIPSAVDVLPPGTTWKFYGTGVDTQFAGTIVWSMFDAIDSVRHGGEWNSNVRPQSEFETDIQNGTLPNVVWLVDQDLDSGHPPLSMCASDTWTTHHVNDIINSKYWDSSIVIVTWDDFGGFYDHVPPPKQYGCDVTHPYGLGFRLPALLVSPWVKKGVFHGVTEQASMVRLIEEVFAPDKVGALHAMDPRARDDVAGSLLPAFDFEQPPLPPTPVQESCP